jgi:23S rRNA pseudouridine1911/1915/1917 synthase
MINKSSKEILLTAQNDASRLDLFLISHLPGFSRTYLQKLIRNGFVKINNTPAKPSDRIKRNDSIHISLPPLEEPKILPEAIPLDFVFEDEHLIVVNKPVGMNVHPVPHCFSGTLVNALLYHCDHFSGIGGTARPGIVHRLDKETSGLIVVAKTDSAHISLSEQLHNHTIGKWYTAVVHGRLKKENVRVDLPISRSTVNRKKMAVVVRGGREAITQFQVIERFAFFTCVDVRTFTGRTHQIRVHAAHIGHPLAGDAVYGGKTLRAGKLPLTMREKAQEALDALKGHALHARRLVFRHPATGDEMSFEAPLRDDIVRFIETLRRIDDELD